jgi:RNA polymerase sigma-70 factor (ECF subfamily)
MTATTLRHATDRTDAAVRSEGRFRARPKPEEPLRERGLVRRAIARAKEGDDEALRFLYVRYADSLFGYVRSIVGDEHDAEDVTQQVFAKLMTAIGSYEERSMPFSAWLIRIAHNAAIDHRRVRRPIPVEQVHGPHIAADRTGQDRVADLCDAFRTLPDEQRDVAVMRYLLGMSAGEIAHRLGRTESSVNGLHHRARLALKRELVELRSAPAAPVVTS